MNALRQALEHEVATIAAANHGVLIPEQIVEAARDPASPLHEEFEWDDSVAAQQHRLNQARTLIRSIRVMLTIEHISIPSRAYVHDPDLAKAQGYAPVAQLRTNEERAQRALATEINRVGSSAARAREIALGLGLTAEIEHQLAEAITGR